MARAHKTERAQAGLFAALGDETRLRLVTRLSGGGALSIKELTRGTKMTRQAVTRHLHVLAGAGLACSKRTGREQLWSLDERRLEQARKFLDRLSRQWDERLGNLRTMLEGEMIQASSERGAAAAGSTALVRDNTPAAKPRSYSS